MPANFIIDLIESTIYQDVTYPSYSGFVTLMNLIILEFVWHLWRKRDSRIFFFFFLNHLGGRIKS